MSNARIRRDLPNDEYQAAVGANNASASNVFATIADLTSGVASADKIIFDAKYDEAGGILKGQAVYISGADGTNILVKKADYSTEATSSKTLGLATEPGALNHQGQVISDGLLSNIDTSAAGAVGDPVWLGDDGNLIYGLINKPYAPNHLVFIGIVTKKNASTGEIFVKVQNGFELDEIHNVDLKTIAPSDGEVLTFDSITGLWKNEAIPNVTLTSAGGSQSLVSDGTGPSLATKGISAGIGISLSSTAIALTVTNSAPDQTVVLTAGTGIGVAGTYPNFTISNTGPTGSGSTNYLARWTPSGSVLGDSIIQDDGTRVGVGSGPLSGYKFRAVTSSETYAVTGNNTNTGGGTGVFGTTSGVTSNINYGVFGNASNSSSQNIGVNGDASQPSTGQNIGIAGRALNGATNYAAWLRDGTEGSNKFLKSVTSDGKANWASLTVADTGLTLTTTGTSGAATLIGNTLNIPQYSGSAVNIYNTDGTLTADRTLTGAGFNLTFDGLNTHTENINPSSGTNGYIINVSTSLMSGSVASRIYKIVDSTAGIERLGITRLGNVKINNTYILPTTDGTVGQVLTTDGGGVVSWATPAAGSSTWNVTTQTGASSTAASNDYVLINAATHIVTLPAAANGIRVGVKMINATVTSIQIKTPSAGITIDGVDRSVTGLGIFNQYDAYTFVSDGTNWFIMG